MMRRLSASIEWLQRAARTAAKHNTVQDSSLPRNWGEIVHLPYSPHLRGRLAGNVSTKGIATKQLIALIIAISVFGCDLPGKPDPKDRPLPAEWVLRFDRLFKTHCQGCHGANGMLGPAPPLNDPLFRALISEEELKRVIAEGRPQTKDRPATPMPAFAAAHGGPLSAAQIQVLAYEIKGIRYRIDGQPGEKSKVAVAADAQGKTPVWGVPAAAPADTPQYLAPSSKGDRQRGVATFAAACASCHGANGKGGKKAGALNNSAFLALISDQALRRVIITGREDLKMPGCADLGLTANDVADLVALLASWRQGGESN